MLGFTTIADAAARRAAMTDRGNAKNDRSKQQDEDEGLEDGAASVPGKTGAGSEASEGIHSAKGKGPDDPSAVTHAHGEPGRGEGAGLSGSEPLRHRETEHKSGYGGEKAEPKTSSDQR
jgi:hypothetical protein